MKVSGEWAVVIIGGAFIVGLLIASVVSTMHDADLALKCISTGGDWVRGACLHG